MGHHRFLLAYHLYQKNKKALDGTIEKHHALKIHNGEHMLRIVKDLKVVLGPGPHRRRHHHRARTPSLPPPPPPCRDLFHATAAAPSLMLLPEHHRGPIRPIALHLSGATVDLQALLLLPSTSCPGHPLLPFFFSGLHV
jgi:hypothetical protein